jgi:hypothetical protein
VTSKSGFERPDFIRLGANRDLLQHDTRFRFIEMQQMLLRMLSAICLLSCPFQRFAING